MVSQKFALLVGVDLYENDGSRKSNSDGPVNLANLSGCVNDVNIVKKFIKDKAGFHPIYELVSPSPSHEIPQQPCSITAPTYENIKKIFRTVTKRAKRNDIFFFHFSGHGALLKSTQKSPRDGRQKDPSLITVDYCCGKRAVRGWELGKWLRRLHDNKVQVVVFLDSCYSAGAWRGDGKGIPRTPQDWIPPPNLPADEDDDNDEEEEVFHERQDRDATLCLSWDINPERLTLMAACKSNEKSHERNFTDKKFGVFTYELIHYLNMKWPRVSTYRTARDQISSRIDCQVPQVYGRDMLSIFDNTEPFSVVPIVCNLGSSSATLPIGRMHGIRTGAQFTTIPPSDVIALSVANIDAFTCIAKVHSDVPAPTSSNEVILRKWSIGSRRLGVFLDTSLEASFQNSILSCLQSRIFGEVIKTPSCHGSPEAFNFGVFKGQGGGIQIMGSKALVGYDGPVRAIELKGTSDDEQAIEVAVILSHLVRFEQILELKGEGSQNDRRFVVSITGDSDVFHHEAKLTYKLTNNSDRDIYYAVVNFSPGFKIRQIYPLSAQPEILSPGRSKEFKLRLTVPPELQKYPNTSYEDAHRDIIRTVVGTSQFSSLKSLELPVIWNARLSGDELPGSILRDGEVFIPDNTRDIAFNWWINDIEIRTRFP
jgi:hypothetical protein